jgi:hypothetical protein
LKLTVDEPTNPVPITLTVVSPDPAKTEVGDSDVKLGTGLTKVMVENPDLVESAWLTAVTVSVVVPDGRAIGAV